MKHDFPGSRWYRCDFHVHSPASGDYKSPAVTPAEWIQGAIDAGLDCIAVTDHNTAGWVDQLEEESRSRREGGESSVWVFPGVEITVLGVHLLALFSPGTTAAEIEGLIGACGIHGPPQTRLGAHSNLGILQVIGEISLRNGVAIAAHIDCHAGLCKEFSDGKELISVLTCDNLHAVELKDHSAPERSKVGQNNPKRLHHELPYFASSDAHEIACMAERSTWVKLGQPPTIEGLRLACFDGVDSVRPFEAWNPVPPEMRPKWYISSITVDQARYLGNPASAVFSFNPCHNALIGGRGSGKSTLIEMLRLGLDRVHPEVDYPEVLKEQIEPYVKFPAGDLAPLTDSTVVRIEYVKDSRSLRVTRSASGFTVEEEGDAGWQPAPEDVRGQCPVTIFSQKQLLATATEHGSLLAFLDQQPAVRKEEWLETRQELEGEYLRVCSELRSFAGVDRAIERLKAQLKDAEAAWSTFSAAPELQAYELRLKQKAGIEHFVSGLVERLQSVEQTLAALPIAIPVSVGIEMDEISQGLLGDLSRLSTKLIQSSADLLAQIRQADADLKAAYDSGAIANFLVTAQQSEQAFLEWQESLQLEGPVPSLKELAIRKDHLELQLQTYADHIAYRAELQSRKTEIELELTALREVLTQRRRSLVVDLNQAEGKGLKLDLVPFGDMESGESSLRSLLNVAASSFQDAFRCDEDEIGKGKKRILDLLTSRPRLEHIEEVRSKLRLAANGQSVREIPARLATNFQRLFQASPEQFDRLQFWWPEDMLRATFEAGGKKRELEKGSQGQRSSIMLRLVLSNGEGPIILDQPEDDLDNAQVSREIVTMIRKMKTKRQIIITTHNANLVVNADAELVTSLDFFKGRIRAAHSGGLQEIKTRTSVCDNLEGGEQAFKLRYRRIVL